MAAYARIREAEEQAAVNRRERHRLLKERLETLESDWNSRQLELRSRARLSTPDRLARFNLEGEYHACLAKLLKAWNIIQQRQAQQTEALAEKRVSAHATVLASYEAEETELRDERQRVSEWWKDIIEDNNARRRKIDEDEVRMLYEVNQMGSVTTVEVEILAAFPETETTRTTVQQELKSNTDAAGQHEKHKPTTAATDIAADSSNPAAGLASIKLISVIGDNVAHADAPKVAESAEKALAAPTFNFDSFRSSSATGIDDGPLPLAALRLRTDITGPLLTEGGSTTQTYSSAWPLHPNLKSPPASDYETISITDMSVIYPEGDIVWDRSGSPDSLDSDYVEILNHI